MLSLVDTFQTVIGRLFYGLILHWVNKGGAIMTEQFGSRLMYLRKGKGLSQEELGNRTGVTRQTISKWELNQTTPEMDKLVVLSDIFGISLDELVGREFIVPDSSINYEELNAKMDTIISSKEPYRYEYKSGRMIGNLPLIHINLGRGFYKAKGVISIGIISSGIISLGVLSCGVISIGVLALGLLSIAVFAAGIISVGSIAVGILALGAFSVGYFSAGAMAIGVYSIGANAIAQRIALGDAAAGHIAIGKTSAKGTIEFLLKNHVSADEIKSAILKEYPDVWKGLLKIYTYFGK
jgi:transcriptional regulator with XRE-family HTH domain